MNQQIAEEEQLNKGNIFNTKLLMISSAIFMGIIGVSGSFIPEEVAGFYGASVNAPGVMLIKIAGSLYLAFAILNWMARGNIIGGIYSRPVALGNFFHFVIVAIILLKYLMTGSSGTTIAIGAGIYSIFAAGFGYILFSGGKACA